MRDSIPKIAITGSGIANVSATNMTKTSSTIYTYDYSVPTGNGTGTISFSVGTDLSGNVVTSSPTSGATFNVDNSDSETDPSGYTPFTSPGNTTYYISYSSGNDSNNGTSEGTPYKNLGKLNSITFAGGDKIKFKSGDTWKGYFKLNGSNFLKQFNYNR